MPPVGGLARRATAINSLREQKPSVLVVDTGGSLTGSSSGAGAPSDLLHARVFAALRYDAVNAGPGESFASADALREVAGSKLPLVSANGRADSPAAVKGLLKTYIVKDVGGIRVALVGVTSNGYADGQEVSTDRQPLDALRAILPEARKQSDVVVVLADLNQSDVDALADAGLGVQVILGGRSQDSRSATLVGSTVVASAGSSGRNVEVLTLQIGSGGQVLTYASAEQALGPSVSDDQAVLKLRREN